MTNPYGVIQIKIPHGSMSKGDPPKNIFVAVALPKGISSTDSIRSEKTDDCGYKLSKDIDLNGAISRGMNATVTVLQWSLIGSDRSLGSAQVSLDNLEIGGAFGPEDVDIKDSKGQVVCKCNININWKEGTMPESASAAAAGAAAGLTKPLGGKPGEKVLPLPECEGLDYCVRVKIHRLKNLQSIIPDKLYSPRCQIHAASKTYKTEVVKKTMDPTFDEECSFNFEKVKSNFWTELLTISVVSDRFGLPDESVGQVQLDFGSVYRSNLTHALIRKWFVVLRGPGDGTVMGYGKISMSVLNLRTDNLVEFEDEDDEEEEKDEDITANLISVTGAAFEEIYLHCDIIRGEGMPKMDAGLSGSCDPYVKLTFGKNNVETSYIADTFNPSWDTRLCLSAMLPALASNLKIELWDHDSASFDDIIATLNLDLNDLMAGRKDNLPAVAARYINFYGHPRACDSDFNRYYKQMARGTKKGLDFRGRILMRLQGSRSKTLPSLPPVRESKVHLDIWCEIMQLSQLPSDNKFKVKTFCGTQFATSQIHQSTKMLGGVDGYSLYMGEKLTFTAVIPVVIPSREDIAASLITDENKGAAAFDDTVGDGERRNENNNNDDDAMSPGADQGGNTSTNLTTQAEVGKMLEKIIWEQIPALVVHLIKDSALSAFADRLSGAKDEEPDAAVVFEASKFVRNGGSICLSKALRLMTDPDASKAGRQPANPLIQLNMGMLLRRVEPASELPIPLSTAQPKFVAAQGRMKSFILSVFVYHCRNVPAGDDNGLSDPYVTVSWANAGSKTGIKKETLNPTFNEALYIESMVKDPLPDVVIELWDWDLIGSDTFLCKSYISLSSVKNNKPFWVKKFSNSFGKIEESTEVLISIMLEPATDERRAALKQLKKIPMIQHRDSSKTYKGYPIPAAHQLAMAQYSFDCKLFGLRQMRKFRLRDITSPMIEFECYTNTTRSERKQGRNADFDSDLAWVLTLPANENFLPYMNIYCYDHRLGLKVLVGIAQVNLTDKMLKIENKRQKVQDDNEKVALHLQELIAYHEKLAQAQFESASTTPAGSGKNADGSDKKPPAPANTSLAASARALGHFSSKSGAFAQKNNNNNTDDTTTNNNNEPTSAGGDENNNTNNSSSSASSPKKKLTFADAAGKSSENNNNNNNNKDPEKAGGEEMKTVDGATSGDGGDDIDAEPSSPAGKEGQTLDEKIKEAQQQMYSELEEPSETQSTVSTEPDEELWFDRFDPESADSGGGEMMLIGPDRRIARLGKASAKCKSLGAGKNSAEHFFGPFDDRYTAVQLFRGWGGSGAKAGVVNLDMRFQKVADVANAVAGASGTAGSQVRAGDARWKPSDSRKKTPFLCRVYILMCRELTAMDSGPFGNSSDPYVVITLCSGDGSRAKTDVVVNCKDQIRYQVCDPEYFFVRELSGELPLHNVLRVTVLDWDRIGRDEVIGFTDIDMEERYYSSRGYSAPKVLPEIGKTYELQNPAAFFGLNHHGSYTEKRMLRSESGLNAGTIEMWVDVFDFNQPVPRPIDIAPPPPIPMELRVVVWNVRDCELTDEAITGEMMTDIYVRGWIDGIQGNQQNTDVHYRSLDGTGNFNWRMIFPIVFDPRLKKVFPVGNVSEASKESGGAASTASRSFFGVRKEAKKLKPRLKVQLWDNDLFPGTDDYIGEGSLSLLNLIPAFGRRVRSGFLADVQNDCRHCATRWPWKLCCFCECCQPDKTIDDMTLAERQEHARKEMREERAARDKQIAGEVKNKIESLQGTFSPEELPRVEKRLTKQIKKSLKVNIFKDFLPQRRKRSQREADDAAHAADMQKKLTLNQEDVPQVAGKIDDEKSFPALSEQPRQWFICRSPCGGVRIGDVQLSFQLVRLDAMAADEKLAAGKGRSDPQAMPEPDRPASSFFWLSSPFKSAFHILWKNYKWWIVTAICLALIALFVYLFAGEAVQQKARNIFA